MGAAALPSEAQSVIKDIRHADVVVGIPSYNNARTIGHVVRAAHAGLAKYFPQFTSVIINSDGGSKDGTREVVLSARMEDINLLLLNTPLPLVHRLSVPYHGIPGKGSAFRLIFAVAEELGAKACAVVDSDLRSITPEWFDLLIRPVLHAGCDFVAPYYHRHKYDGTITNSIVYPMTRALYGLRVRQPIGGDFGVSNRLVSRYLKRGDWETDVARYGVDIWMTTIAIAEGFRVCQSFLGAKLHDAKDPSADLSAMLTQVIGSVFVLMQEFESVWRQRTGSEDCDVFGFRFDVGLDPIDVNVERMITAFCRGCSELGEVWGLALQRETMKVVRRLAEQCGCVSKFCLEDELWARILYEFSAAYKRRLFDKDTLLRSLTPLYLGRVASFVNQTRDMVSSEVEKKIEESCLTFEHMKPYLLALWDSKTREVPIEPPPSQPAPAEVGMGRQEG